MKATSVVSFIIIFSLFIKHCLQTEVADPIQDVVKYSFKSPFCLYLISDENIIANTLAKLLLKLKITVVIILQNSKTDYRQRLKLPLLECNGCIIASDKFTFLKEFFYRHYALHVKPYMRILIIYDGEESLIVPDFTYFAEVKGIDIITVEGINFNQGKDPSGYNGLKVTSLISKKQLGFWNSQGNWNFNKQDFDNIQWLPKFNHDRNTYFKISAFNCSPFLIYDPREGVYDGIEYRILKDAFKNWPLKFIIYTNETSDSSDLYTTVRDDVESGLTDIALCSHWQMNASRLLVDISRPYRQVCVTFLVPKPKLLPHFLYVFQPLRTELWCLILFVILLITLILHLIGIHYKVIKYVRHPYSDISLSLLDSIQSCTFGCLRYLRKVSQNFRLKFTLSFLCIQAVLLTTAYLAGFASLLIYPRYNKPIRNFQDMLEHNIYWETGHPTYVSYVQTSHNPIVQQLMNLQLPVRNAKRRNKRIQNDNVALAVRRYDYGYVTDTDTFNDYAKTNLKVLSDCFMTSYLIFPLKKYSPFNKIINKHISRVFEHGLIKYWQKTMYKKTNKKYMSNFYSGYWVRKTKQYSLTLADVQGTFYLLGTGYVIASFSFLIEILLNRIWNRIVAIFGTTQRFC